MLGMFGNSSRRRTMADQGMMGAMPDSLAAPQLQTMAMPPMPAQPVQPMPQQGMRPTGARRVAGLLSSFVSGALGQPDRYGDSIRQQEEQQRQLQLRQQLQAEDRAYEESQWQRRQDYARANPEPTAIQRDLEAAGYTPGSPEYAAQMQAYIRSRNDPLTPFNNGDGTYTLIRPSQLQSNASPTPSGPAVGSIHNGYRFRGGNPNDRNSWEPVGGQTQPASGNFR